MILVNGKSFEDWDEYDINTILQTPEDYREDEFLDYKKTFSHLEIDRANKSILQSKKNEFRNDICCFANSDGGLIIYGISDESGTPKELSGIVIDKNDTDKFELDRRNELQKIQPVTPNIKFKFIRISKIDKYVVIICIYKGYFSPYLVIDENNKICGKIRIGNGKKDMNYTELRNSFNNSRTVLSTINKFRDERIDDCNYMPNTFGSDNRFLLLHIIPEDFLNQSSFQKMYLKEYNNECHFSDIFRGFCFEPYIPFSDGLFYPNSAYGSEQQVRIYNSGITELYMNLSSCVGELEDGRQNLAVGKIIKTVTDFTKQHIEHSRNIHASRRLFVAMSIVGCDGLVSQPSCFGEDYGMVIGSRILCVPVEIINIDNKEIVKEMLKNVIVTVCLASGVSNIDKYLNTYHR